MFLRSRTWLAVFVVFSLVNLAGGVIAAVQGEPLHAGAHAGLFLLCISVVWWLAPRRDVRRVTPRDASGQPAFASDLAGRLTRLEQALDAVAIEIERIGEGQRFVTRTVAERAESYARGDPASLHSAHQPPHRLDDDEGDERRAETQSGNRTE